MDLLILILGVPAILIPLVLLFGFTGCAPASRCIEDLDCPRGTQCVDGACVDLLLGEPDPPPRPSAPENLAAIALDDRSVSLTWINTDPAVTDFRIERAPEDGDFAPIPDPADLSATGATDTSGLQEGVTFIYRVRALLGEQVSDPSDESSATVLPAAPVSLVATPVSIDQIDLSWNNASAVATEFALERRDPGGTFTQIFRGAGTTYSDSDPSLVEGTPYDYRVFAIVVDGVENNQRQDVRSAPSAVASATIAFTAAFTAPPGTLTIDQPGVEGFCVIQVLHPAVLAAGGTHQVRITLRGSTAGSLTLDKVTISQAAATGNPYDAAPDLTDVASGVTIPLNTAVTVGPVNYTLDPSQDLLVAFDISQTTNEGNARYGPLLPIGGGDSYSIGVTAEAGVQIRTSGYGAAIDNLYLIDKIEVL